jgi:hypothetical protein
MALNVRRRRTLKKKKNWKRITADEKQLINSVTKIDC